MTYLTEAGHVRYFLSWFFPCFCVVLIVRLPCPHGQGYFCSSESKEALPPLADDSASPPLSQPWGTSLCSHKKWLQPQLQIPFVAWLHKFTLDFQQLNFINDIMVNSYLPLILDSSSTSDFYFSPNSNIDESLSPPCICKQLHKAPSAGPCAKVREENNQN